MNKELPVIVLGAGLSGLYAAHLLAQAGEPVIVLEARKRLGGRVDTRTSSTGLIYEMGGEWIGVNDRYMRGLCDEFNLPLVDHRLKTHFLHNGTYTGPSAWTPSALLKRTIEKFVKRFPSLTEDEILRLQSIDWWHFLMKNGVPPEEAEMLDLIRSTDFGEDMRFVPAYDVLYDYVVGGAGDTGCAYHVDGGNARMIDALADSIGREHVRLNVEVTSVVQKDGSVMVKTKGGEEFLGARVIAAIATQAVSRIEWLPALPAPQQDAFDEIVYCRITKTAIEFRERFWKEDGFELVTDHLPHQIYHATQGQPAERGILMSYATGDRAYVMGRLSDDEKKSEICGALDKVFSATAPLAGTVDSYYWGDDPYTGGAYPLFERSDRTGIKKLLAVAHGRVHFAGEHTAKRYGFMEGAVEAGARAATEALRALAKKVA